MNAATTPAETATKFFVVSHMPTGPGMHVVSCHETLEAAGEVFVVRYHRAWDKSVVSSTLPLERGSFLSSVDATNLTRRFMEVVD